MNPDTQNSATRLIGEAPMPPRLRAFVIRHSTFLILLLPALLLGGVLRLLLCQFLPYAYWGSDSQSYFSFAHQFLDGWDVSLDEKRRYVYPLLMLPVAVLPGATLKWVAWLQHGMGLASVIAIGVAVRHSLVAWRAWIVPITLLFAGWPTLLWYEHELLGEAFFYCTLTFALAGWTAWAAQREQPGAARLWWWWFVPLACFFLTKPAGKFLLPGLALGLLLFAPWRTWGRVRWIAVALLVAATATVGSSKQGKFILCNATFPLMRLDTPSNAEFKADIRPMWEKARANFDAYHDGDSAVIELFENPRKHGPTPRWQALAKDDAKRNQLYKELAVEAIRSDPLGFAWLGWQRLVFSANFSEFKDARFQADYFPEKFEHHYEEAIELLAKNKRTPIPMAFGFPKRGPLPPFAELRPQLCAGPDATSGRWLRGWTDGFNAVTDVVNVPPENAPDRSVRHVRPTLLGVLLAAGLALTFILPRYRLTLGVWVLAALSYLAGTFLVSRSNPRYFAPVWPVMMVVLAVPLDAMAAAVRRKRA